MSNTELDISELIAEALARTTEPVLTNFGAINPNKEELIGVVPLHLRHLNNLLSELGRERYSFSTKPHSEENHDLVHKLFYTALKQHLKLTGMNFRLCDNWQVARILP